MELPIELFITFIGTSIALALFGFMRNPQIPATVVFAGMFILFIAVTTETIILDTFAFPNGGVNVMDLLVSSTGITIRSDSSWIRAEYVENSASKLAGAEVNCLTAQLSRNGNPPFDTPIVFAVFDSSANIKFEFGRMNVTETTSSIQFFERCNQDATYTIVNSDRIGIMWNDGNSTNNIAIRYDSSNPFDGTNSIGNNYNGAWNNEFPNDYSLIIGLENGGEVTQSNFTFTELPKVIFSLLGAIFMLSGALMVFKGER